MDASSMHAGGRPRLLVLNQYYGPSESTGQLLREMCEDMAATLDVTVVAAKAEDEETRAMTNPGVDVRWIPATSFGKGSLLRRLSDYVTFVFGAALTAMRSPRPDVVLCMTNPPFVGMLGALVCRLRGGKLVVGIQDILPDVGVISGRLTNPGVIFALRAVQKFLIRNADQIVAISEAMKQRLVERGADPDRVEVISNWVDVEEIKPHPRDNRWAREHEIADRFTVMHAGNVGLQQALEVLIDAAALVPEASVVIVGEGANKEGLVEQARSSGLSNVTFVPRQPREDLNLVLASADAHVVALLPGLGGLMEPSKLYGVLAAGRPTIAGMEPGTESAVVLERAECGVVVPPGDAAALADGIRRLEQMSAADREQMGQRARAYCERFCIRSRSTGKYLDLVVSLASR